MEGRTTWALTAADALPEPKGLPPDCLRAQSTGMQSPERRSGTVPSGGRSCRKSVNAEAAPSCNQAKAADRLTGSERLRAPAGFRRGSGAGMHGRCESVATREALPVHFVHAAQPEPREGQAGHGRVADGPVVPETRW